MKIVKYKKIGVGKYKIFFNDSELTVYEDIILKYNLLRKNEINIEDLEKIIEENKYYDVYGIALKYISTKLRTKKELESYLLKKKFDVSIINRVVLNIEKAGYLNEKNYATSYINDDINFKNNGPYKIKELLINLGIEEYIIEDILSKIDNTIWIKKVEKYIEKCIRTNKKYSINMLKQKILNDLFVKGYEKEMIYEILNSINVDDADCLNKEYEKAYNKYSKKYKGSILENKIITYLKLKGYDYYKIKEQIKKLD